MIEYNKEQWLKNIPEMIYGLKVKYNFYYSGFYAKINRDILDIISKAKHKHKIVLYNRNNRFFLVVYKKNGPDVYFTNEYRKDTKNNRIQYFTKKFKRAYKRAEVVYEQEESKQMQECFNRNF